MVSRIYLMMHSARHQQQTIGLKLQRMRNRLMPEKLLQLLELTVVGTNIHTLLAYSEGFQQHLAICAPSIVEACVEGTPLWMDSNF